MWGGAEVGRRYHRRVPLVVSIALFSLLAVFAAAMLWQERRGVPERAVVYGVEDSIEFVYARLDRTDVTKTDVRRILEWSVRYLQDPVGRTGGGRATCHGRRRPRRLCGGEPRRDG